MRTNEHRVVFYDCYELEEMTPDLILKQNECVERTLKDCDNLIKWLKDYQKKLAEQYNKLTIAGSHTRIVLKREKRWKEKIYYFLTIYEVYENGSTKILEHTRYAGTDRHIAISRFEELCKENPHWEQVKDIKKPTWE